MPYDLGTLDDKEFEVLCCRILSLEHQCRFERFKPGRDKGVDGRYFSPAGGETILQCKHWHRTPAPALIRALENKELPKVKSLAPTRYVLATSAELSRTDKSKIASIFSGFIQSESDILGAEDLQDLLARNPAVIKEHPGLWLASAEVIGLIQNAAILGRSDFSLDDIRRRASRYVLTDSHRQAKSKLESIGAVLITGLPGVGKTTLAEQLCLEYVLDGYQLCVLADSIEEAEAIFDKDRHQIFYFDDFLGRNYLEALGRHEDSRIVSFINRVTRDPKKRFVLTSRTTVLNQAKILTDQFHLAKVDRTELEIRVQALELIDRAQILHKHVWYSDLRREVLTQLIESGRYMDVVKHQNFNPRLIQFITDAQRFDSDEPSKYWDYIQETLSNPAAVWQHVLDNQLDDYSRSLLLLCCFDGGSGVDETDLRAAFLRLKEKPIARTFSGNGEFIRNSRLVTGSVLSRAIGNHQGVQYSLFNPSVADYVFSRYSTDTELLIALLGSLQSVSSVKTLRDLKKNGLTNSEVTDKVFGVLLRELLADKSLPVEYRIAIANAASDTDTLPRDTRDCLVQGIPSVIAAVTPEIRNWVALGHLLVKMLQLGVIRSVQIQPIFTALKDTAVDDDEAISLSHLYNALDNREKEIFEPILRTAILDLWENSISDVLSDHGVMDEFVSDDDLDRAEETAEKFIQDKLGEYPFAFNTTDIQSILNYVDVSGFIYSNQKRNDRSYDDRVSSVSRVSTSDDVIHDLFNMDLPKER